MKADTLCKEFFSDDARFADVINGFGCGGRQIVTEQDLHESDTQVILGRFVFEAVKKRKLQKMRDLVRKTAFGVNFAIIGIENQEEVDYALPLRNMVYDAGEYEKQAVKIRKKVRKNHKNLTSGEYLYGFQKDSRLYPVVTFVLYYGEEEWDAANNLHEIIDFTDIPEELKVLVQNFKINLIDIRKMADTSMFQTDVKQVFDFIRYAEDTDKLKQLVQNDVAYQAMEEDAYDMVASYTKTRDLLKVKEYHKREGKVNMCKALEGLIEEGRMEGLEQGIMAFIQDNLEEGITENRILEKLQRRFDFSEEKAKEYISRYGKK